MAQREFTPEQRRAIDTRDRTLLVSAAAGSGKTATLTERIISSLLDEKNPTDITSILVVTFTNAAAGELRERIGAALSAAIKSGKTALVGQLRLLSMASISTIDSFCADVLRQNAERVGISPSFRIADEAESELLLLSVLEGLVDSIYEGMRPEVASAEELAELSFALSDAKNPAALYEVLEFIYEKLITTENGIKSLLPLINVYKNEEKLPTEEKTYGKYIMQSLRAYTEHFTRVISSIRDEIPTLADYGRLAAVMDADLSFLHSLGAAKTYGEARELLLNRKHPTKPTFKSNEPPHFAEYVRARDKMKEEAGEFFTKRLFSYTDEEWQRLYSGLYEKLSVLYKFLLAFDEDFAREKKMRGICRYSDVERYAYECLWQGGKRTDVAEALREKYSAVYIDEYQDVNNLQDKIFEAISRPNNRFMVGDIKQSIYAFRSARPEIFAKMKNEFPDIESSTGDTASIFMSKNFRSDRGIIDFTNAVFDRAFSAFGESIGYKNEDRLTFAKTAPSSDSTPTLTVFDKGDKEEDEDGEELGRLEPRTVAEKIHELLESGRLADGSAVKPSDIAIIMRSVRGRSTAYKEALDELGIPSEIVESKSFFLNSEVLLALCLLNSIDNPRRDIYLGGLMRSPIFAFSADELVRIRAAGGHTLYDSLKNHIQNHPEDEKCKSFLSRLYGWRDVSEGMNVHSLIAKLYHETSLLSLAARSGGKENLILLYDLARRFEGSEFKGLYSFISYINNVINKRARFEDSASKAEENAVKIVTVHGSKGLEYPIVFFADTGKTFSDRDSRSRAVYFEDFGISMYLRSSDGLALVENPVREVINMRMRSAAFEEELRVLYVALTRAREMLFVSGERSSKKENYDLDISILKRCLNAYAATKLKSHLSVMLAAGVDFDEGEQGGKADTEASENGAASTAKETVYEAAAEKSDNEGEYESLRELLISRFSFSYPYKYLTEIPEKLSVSALYPAVLDGTEGLAAQLESAEEKNESDKPDSHKIPRFIGGRTKAEESALSGIATHLYLQFCRLDALIKYGAEAELSRLVADGFISEQDAARVRLDEIELFRKSELIGRMTRAKKLWRELRFNIRLPAESFTENPERRDAISGKSILVQGVIDCIIEGDNGELTVIDYKTDRLTEGELSDQSLAKKKLTERHASQLSYYRAAVTKMFGKPPSHIEIYSLPLGKSLEIETQDICSPGKI